VGLWAVVMVWLAVPRLIAAPVGQEWLADLASDDFETRQHASGQLLTDDLLSPQDAAALFALAKTPEQRHRLMAVARHHFVERLRTARFPADNRGSIGIVPRGMSRQQLPSLGRSAIRVVHTFPGFPGYAYLEPGDLILTVDDQSMPDNSDAEQLGQRFVSMIQNFRATDTVRFSVWRNGETLLLTFRLAGSDALRALYHPHDQSLQPPFADEWAHFRDQMLADAQTDQAANPAQDSPPARDPKAAPPVNPPTDHESPLIR
jgi:hypothetical protein